MHEASIAESIVDFLLDYERKNRFSVDFITIEIGKLSGVSIESLDFCLKVISDTLERKWKFKFVEKPLIYKCNDCLLEFESEGFNPFCKKCNSLNLNMISGLEMNIVELEGEEIEGKNCSVVTTGQ